jgi:hypothetical protein
MNTLIRGFFCGLLFSGWAAAAIAGDAAPTVLLSDAPPLGLPGGLKASGEHFVADSNSPCHWSGDTLHVFNSHAKIWHAAGPDLFRLGEGAATSTDSSLKDLAVWVESTWKEENGPLYGWVHNEFYGRCPDRPGFWAGYPVFIKIRAVRSNDNGASWEDLGVVLSADDKAMCQDSDNFWYGGGYGDFCVIADQEHKFFYFFFTSYAPDFAEQGICLARMPFQDLAAPAGKVRIWRGGTWDEPGLDGRPTPILPAKSDIHRKGCLSFWGPSIHWNTYLKKYVMLLNLANDLKWGTEGFYISFADHLDDPNAWSEPVKFLDAKAAGGKGWYAQVVGLEKGETDKVASRVARLFVDGRSIWEIRFQKPGDEGQTGKRP